MKLWEALKAHGEGKEVEYKMRENKSMSWRDDFSKLYVTTGADKYLDFRLKPKPIEGWVNVYPNCAPLYDTREQANAGATPDRICCVKLREVVE